MHYGAQYFGRTGADGKQKQTIVPLIDGVKIGQRESLSLLDIEKLNRYLCGRAGNTIKEAESSKFVPSSKEVDNNKPGSEPLETCILPDVPADVETKTEPKPGQADQTRPEPKSEAEAEPIPEPFVEPKSEPFVEPKSEPFVEPTSEPLVQPQSELFVETKSEPFTQPKPEPNMNLLLRLFHLW